MRKPRVLLVDDDRDSLEMLTAFLSMSGFLITAVDSAIAALTLDFDDIFAVVTDLSMPGLDGFEFVRWLRTVHASRQISIIAVTGHPVGSTAVLQRELGCCRVFVKPCDLDELAKTLDGLLAAAPPSR